MQEDMDVNCGENLDGAASVGEMGARIFRLILETASARREPGARLRRVGVHPLANRRGHVTPGSLAEISATDQEKAPAMMAGAEVTVGRLGDLAGIRIVSKPATSWPGIRRA